MTQVDGGRFFRFLGVFEVITLECSGTSSLEGPILHCETSIDRWGEWYRDMESGHAFVQ